MFTLALPFTHTPALALWSKKNLAGQVPWQSVAPLL
jgi:hypothetical protein